MLCYTVRIYAEQANSVHRCTVILYEPRGTVTNELYSDSQSGLRSIKSSLEFITTTLGEEGMLCLAMHVHGQIMLE